jgi:branched-chain amino acid transport system substrate-binding protein
MLSRRTLLHAAALAMLPPLRAPRAQEMPPGDMPREDLPWEDMPWVTDREIRIGSTAPYSGPLAPYSAIAQTQAAYFRMVNARGGVNGRRITFISRDDGYSPRRTLDQTRRLVTEERVALLFNGLGTRTQAAARPYLNNRRVPQLFVGSPAEEWDDPQHYPWSMGFSPSARTEAEIYGKFIRQERPGARIGVLYQNDGFGQDYLIGLRRALGDAYPDMVVKEASYEVTDVTIERQARALKAAGADAVVTAAASRWAIQMIRAMAALDWKPLHCMTYASSSVGVVIRPAGLAHANGMITAEWLKDPTDARWAHDPGMASWRAFMVKHYPAGDVTDINTVYGYAVAHVLMRVLTQCGADLSRANIMRQAANLVDLEVPVLLPGVRVNTSPANYRPIRAMRLHRWGRSGWEPFGPVISV